MVAAYAEADLAVDLEAAGGGEEAEGRRAQRVGGRQGDAAVVDARGVGRGRGRAAQGEVPFEEVGFQRRGVVVGRGLRFELGGFADCAGVSRRLWGLSLGWVERGRRTDALDGGCPCVELAA